MSGGVEYEHARIIVDARIDNEVELRRALGAPDAGVAELLIRAYLTWGEEFVLRLSGDFALVLWDGRLRRLVAAADPFGIRPLFYRSSRAEVWLAGSVGQLRQVSNEGLVLDDQRIAEHLLGVYVSGDRTFFRDIRQLPAGHLLSADSTDVRVRRYWRPPSQGSTPIKIAHDEFREEFHRLFVESVGERLRSSAPVIVHVSGGLDSSSVAGAADLIGRAGNWPTPYVRGAAGLHPGLTTDEGPFIDAVARRVQFPIERWDATLTGPTDPDLEDPSDAQPGVRALNRGGTIGDIAIARAHGASVVLSGIGGDELGTVFGFVKDLIADRRWSTVLDELLFFPGATMRTRAARLKQVVRQSVPSELLRWVALARASAPTWLAPRLRQLASELRAPASPGVSLPSHLARYVWERVTSVRLARAITQSQEHASAHGVEYRFPFLDRELVTFVMTVSHEHWPRPRPFARLHREPLADLLPPEVAQRFGKAEFTPALIGRVRGARSQIETILEHGPWYSDSYIDRSEAQKLWRSVSSAEPSPNSTNWLAIWAIATLEAWLRRSFGYTSASPEAS
jgi:asparagine synthase (glutamine-hydrolysing)